MRSILALIAIAMFYANTGCRNSTDLPACCFNDSVTGYKNTFDSSRIKVDSAIVDSIFLQEELDKHGWYANFNYQWLRRDSSTYICFVGARGNVMAGVDISGGKKTFQADLSSIISRPKRYSNVIINDTFHLVNNDDKIYYQYVFDSSFQLKKVFELKINDLFPKHSFINTNITVAKKIAYSYPYLFVPYGRFGKKNEIDNKSIMQIDLRNNKAQKILKYPEAFYSCFFREKYPIVDVVQNKLYAVFLKDNQVRRVDILTGETTVAPSTGFHSNYMCFDPAQQENLAYTGKYDLNDEENYNLIYNDNRFYLVKRLRKTDKSAPPYCAILVFDKELNYQFAFYPPHTIAPRLSTAYDKGVLILSDKLDTGYYYAFSEK